jgi:hypothetical protein
MIKTSHLTWLLFRKKILGCTGLKTSNDGHSNLFWQVDINLSKRFQHLAMESITKDVFLAAATDTHFRTKWMTSDTWAELNCLDLNKVFQSRSNLYLTTQLDVDHSNIPVDNIGIFRDCYKDLATNKKWVCYYACEKGKAPKVTKGVKLFHEVVEAIELKTKFKTRKEKCILVVNGAIVSQNPNKRKIELMKPFLQPLTLPHLPPPPPHLLLSLLPATPFFGNQPKLRPFFNQKKEKQ